MDLTQTAAVGIVAGVCSRAVIGVATGVLKSCAVGGIVLYASQYSGFFKLDTAKIKRSARALVGKVDLLGALEKLGFPDDPAGIPRCGKSNAIEQTQLLGRHRVDGVISHRHKGARLRPGRGPVGGERAPRAGRRRRVWSVLHGLRDQFRCPATTWGERRPVLRIVSLLRRSIERDLLLLEVAPLLLVN